MINIGDIIEVEIEKMTSLFEGVARYSNDKLVVFVPQGLPQEKLKVEIIQKNKSFLRAKIIEIIKPNKNRIKPLCALYNACGSCEVQHCTYNYSLLIKDDIIKDIFCSIIDKNKIYPIIKSPVLDQYRKKVQFPCTQTKNSKRILMGYYKKNSHNLTNIKFCPLIPSIMNEINEFIRDNCPVSCYVEKTKKGLLKNTIARFNHKNDLIITFVFNDKRFKNKDFELFCQKLVEKFPIVKGVFVNLNPNNTNTILSETTIKIIGCDCIVEQLDKYSYKIGPLSFFQVNPAAACELFRIIRDNIKDNAAILDAFGGVGAIGIYLKEKVKKTTLVEINKEACKLAKENYELNRVQNYEIFSGNALNHLEDFKKQGRAFDYVLLDPPRKGCDKNTLSLIKELTKNIIYVSCNPQTLKRDIIYLIEEGFKVEFLRSIDLFPYTHHIECVCKLSKEN